MGSTFAGLFLNKNTTGHDLVRTIMFTPHTIASDAITMAFAI